MKRTGILITLSLLALAAPVAADSIDKTLDADSTGHVEISNISGSIVVKGWSRDAVHVEGRYGKRVEEIIFERDDDFVLVKVKVPKKGGNQIDADLTIRVPEGSSLDVGTVSAEIDVEGVEGSMDLSSVSGSIESTFMGEELSAESVSGSIEINGNGRESEIRLSTVSGSVRAVNLGGEVWAESVSGGVTVDEGEFSRVHAETVSGKIGFLAALQRGARIDFETVSGSIRADFKGEVSGVFKLSTFSGSIGNCFGPEPEKTRRYGPGRSLKFEHGKGSGRITMSTMSGSIRMCQE